MALSGLSSIARLQSLTQVLGAGGDSFRKQVPRLSNITAELEFNVMASVNSPTALSHSSCGDTHVKTLSPRRRPAWHGLTPLLVEALHLLVSHLLLVLVSHLVSFIRIFFFSFSAKQICSISSSTKLLRLRCHTRNTAVCH